MAAAEGLNREEEEGNFHVAIVGAGIAGLSLALALHNQGVGFTMYEEAREFSVVGAGIGFGPNGLRAMDSIEPRFRKRYDGVCVGNRVVGGDGGKERERVFFEGLLLEEGLGLKEKWYTDGELRSAWGHEDYTRKSAHRKELLDIMTDYLPKDQVKFNKTLRSITQDSSGVALTFKDGEVAHATLLVGAEGIQSTARRYVLQNRPEEIEPIYAGSYCYRAVIPMAEAQEILGDLTDVAKFYFGVGRACVTYRISGGKEFNFLLCVANGKPWPSKDTVTEKVSHEEMMNDFADPKIDERFRRLLTKANPIKWGLFHHRHTSTYYRGRVALAGDSAHASLPFQAAGAGQGVEDALIMGSVLAKLAKSSSGQKVTEAQVEAAFKAYDAVRRPRAQKQLEQSDEVATLLYFHDREAGSDMEKILPRLQKGRFEWLWFHDLESDVERALQMMNAPASA